MRGSNVLIFASETDCLKFWLPLMKLLFFSPQKLWRIAFVLWSLVIPCTRRSYPQPNNQALVKALLCTLETFDLYTLQEIASGCIYSPVYCDLFTQ